MRVNVLLANILANPLCELAAQLAGYVLPQGWIVLSGILQAQVAGVLAAYAPYFDLDEPAFQGDWALVSGRRRG